MKRFVFASAAALALTLGVPSEAQANGRFPESSHLYFSKTDPNLVLLRVTFGLLVSHDRGATWDWVCETSIGYSGVEDPMYAIGPSGRVIATTFQGITMSQDNTCSWAFVGDPQTTREVFIDLTQNPNDAKNILALSSGYRTVDPNGNSIFDSQLWETKDEGTTFTKLGPPLDTRLLAYTLDFTKSDPNRIYLTAVRERKTDNPDLVPPRQALLLTSTDRGLTWTEQEIPLLKLDKQFEFSLFIAAVDPNDADKVYLRTSNNPDQPGRLILREKDPTDPTKGVFRTLYTSKAPLDGFALSTDNTKIWIGSTLDGVWQASTTDYAFTQKSTTAVKCLAAADDGLWACSNEAAKPVPFVAGLSSDDGASWTSKSHFCDIRGPLACSAESTTAQQCIPLWPLQRNTLGCDPTGGGVVPDGGFVNDAGGFDEDRADNSSGCVLGVVRRDPTRWSAYGMASAAAIGIALLRRRRRR